MENVTKTYDKFSAEGVHGMKVVIVCDVLGKPNNGTTLAAYNLIGFLRENGHEVTVVCADKDKEGMEGYEIVPIKNFGPINLILKANHVTLAKGDKKVLARAIEGADVVHVLMPFFLGVAAAKLAKKAGIPVTASFHAQAENVTAHIACMNLHLANHITYLFFYNLLYKRVDLVHYPTQFIKDLFEKEVGHTTPSRIISNGVNKAFFSPRTHTREGKFTILCTGRFSKEKDQRTLIKAVALSEYRDDIRILFAGCGPREKELKKLAARKHVEADFRFYAREDLPAVLQQADLYVHTALVEIEAISCLEAIASGLVPIICKSPRSATKSFAVDENCLFTAGNAKELAERISFFYRDPAKIEEYERKYAVVKENFHQEDCMRQMEQMLLDAADMAK